MHPYNLKGRVMIISFPQHAHPLSPQYISYIMLVVPVCGSYNVPLLLYLAQQSTGWPGTVAVMGNWFGKKNRGLFLGIWNAHTSVGNILGTTVPSIWAQPGKPWYLATESIISSFPRVE